MTSRLALAILNQSRMVQPEVSASSRKSTSTRNAWASCSRIRKTSCESRRGMKCQRANNRSRGLMTNDERFLNQVRKMIPEPKQVEQKKRRDRRHVVDAFDENRDERSAGSDPRVMHRKHDRPDELSGASRQKNAAKTDRRRSKEV